MPKLRRSTLSSDTYDAVKDMLLTEQRFSPGEKLSVESIARELGVSRSPAWAAISRLGIEGFLEINPRQGVFVAPFDAHQLRSLFETRIALEGYATRLATMRASDAALDEIDQILQRQEQIVGCARDDFSTSALNFHLHIAKISGNSAIMHHLETSYMRVSMMCGGTNAEADQSVQQKNYEDHLAIAKFMRQRDGDAAEAAARQHVVALMERVLATKAPDPKGADRAISLVTQ